MTAAETSPIDRIAGSASESAKNGVPTPALLAGIDWQHDRAEVGRTLGRMLPVETLLPDIYAEWKPVVRDAVAFVGAHLSRERLLPKLIEQTQLPLGLPLEKRLLILIREMPSLQKIGQMVARDRNLDAPFREELRSLENAVDDVSAEEIRAVVESELGERLHSHQIEMERGLLAEASVSAVIRFSWVAPGTSERRRGVFKVLKPYIRDHFSEELEILSGLAKFFDTNREAYGFSEVNLCEVFEEVRRLLEQEIRFEREQANLQAAARRYAKVAGVRVPKLIESLSTAAVTAMSEEEGVKVTEAFTSPRERARRRKIAVRLIEALVAVPLLSPEGQSVIHADPHAGNLFVDSRNGDLLLFDWALTSPFNRAERRAILLFLTAVTLRDRRLIARAAAKLCENDLDRDARLAEVLQREVRRFVDGLSPLSYAGVAEALTLLDRLIRAGIVFSSSLIIFRKMLFTLDGVLHDVMPGMRLDPTLAWYFARERTKANGGLQRIGAAAAADFDSPLSVLDQLHAAWSAQFFPLRAGVRTGRRIRRLGVRKLRKFLAG